MLSKNLAVCLAGALVLATGCGHRSPLAPETITNASRGIAAGAPTTDGRTETQDGATRIVEGVIGPGALYAIHVPANWNGDLVVYVHGYAEEPGDVALPNIGYFRDPLLAQGFAFICSSFSENGYALQEGAQQTHQLRGVFVSRFGHPRRTFIVGQSLGGIIGLKLAEKYPTQYDGALLGCGVVGGTKSEIEYIATVRVLFDYFYPGVIPGSLLDVPEGVDFRTYVVPRMVAAIQAHPEGVGALVRIAGLNLPFANTQELVEAIVRAIGFQWMGAHDFLDRNHGHVFFDNTNVVYTGALPAPLLADLNARVARYQASPDAENFMASNYAPTGELRIPVITLHTTRDPVVPIFNEDLYASTVGRAGCSNMLLRRQVQTFGHCTYSPQDLIHGFTDLVAWQDTGVRPNP